MQTSILLILHILIIDFRSISALRKLHTDLTSIYFIGDLHGDASCAKQWVEKTNLVNLTSTPYQFLGNPRTDAIVFLGDYVDKGSSSASVLTFVRELQETFPENVVTMLGNHDFFLILDTAFSFSKTNPHPLGQPMYDSTYAFVHPEEYIESGWSPNRDDDEEIIISILSALQYIYELDMHGEMHLCAPNCTANQVDLFENVPPFNRDEGNLKERAVERLFLWRKEYASGLFDSGLLQWLTKQPLVAIVGDALVVHGGVSNRLLNHLENTVMIKEKIGSLADVVHSATNVPFSAFFEEQFKNVYGANKIEERLTENHALELILDMVQHRGYFDSKVGCKEVNNVLGKFNDQNLERIVVGHTPHDYALELCEGKLLASDSSLSRSYRAHGNMYCPLNEKLGEYKIGQACSANPNEFCEGSISRIHRASPADDWPTNMQIFKFDELLSPPSTSNQDEL